MCCGGGWGDRRGMKDRKERVIYDICKSTQQDEVSYDTEVKRDQVHSRGQRRRRRDEGDGGQDDKHS